MSNQAVNTLRNQAWVPDSSVDGWGKRDEETNANCVSTFGVHFTRNAGAISRHPSPVHSWQAWNLCALPEGQLQYVGLASNLRGRLHRHLRDRHKDSWDHFSAYLTIDNRGMKELETLLLRIVSPSGNRVGGKFVRSQNLAVQIRRDLRNLHREQERVLVPVRRLKASEPKSPLIEDSATTPPRSQLMSRLQNSYEGSIRENCIGQRFVGMGRSYTTESFTDRRRRPGSQYASERRMGGSFGNMNEHLEDWVPLSKIRD